MRPVGQLHVARYVHRHDRRQLGAAVTLHRLDAQRGLQVAGQLGLELFGPHDPVSDRLELLRFATFQVQPRERRRARQQRHLVLVAELADRPGIERVEVINNLLVQADGRPDRDREAERVEKRQDAQEDLLGLQANLLLDLMDVGEDVAMGQHDPLGIAGRSRGEDHGRRRVQMVVIAAREQRHPEARSAPVLATAAAQSLSASVTCFVISSSRINCPLGMILNRSSTFAEVKTCVIPHWSIEASTRLWLAE